MFANGCVGHANFESVAALLGMTMADVHEQTGISAIVTKKAKAEKSRDTILAGITNARMKKKAELLANAAIAGVKVNKLTAKLEAVDEATACSNAYSKSNVRPSLGACVATAAASGRRLASAMYDVELLFSSTEVSEDALTAATNSLKAEGVQGVTSAASWTPSPR